MKPTHTQPNLTFVSYEVPPGSVLGPVFLIKSFLNGVFDKIKFS